MLKDPDKEIAITLGKSFVVELENATGKKMILLDKKNNSQFVYCILTGNDVFPVFTKETFSLPQRREIETYKRKLGM